jgi:hypothetical protein
MYCNELQYRNKRSGLHCPYEFAAQHINVIQQQAAPQFEAAQAAEQDEVPAAGLSD